MRRYEILNTREVKKINKQIEEQFGIKEKLNFGYLKNNKNKIFIISKVLDQIELERMKINKIGLYFGKQEKNGFRLSIEGAQLLKPKKNVIEVNEEHIKKWIKGQDLKIKTKEKGPYVVIRFKKDIYGCGRLREGIIYNMVPKERHLKELS